VQALNISFNKEALRPVMQELIGESFQKAALNILAKTETNEIPPESLERLNVLAQAFGFVICKCGHSNEDSYNFCGNCGNKLHEICPHCWQKEGQSNSCLGNECPPKI